MILIYSTFKNKEEAVKIAEGLVSQKLAAGVDITPIISVYSMDGKIEKSEEVSAIIKTRKINFRKVEKFILENHSDKVPCIIGIPVRKVNKKCYRWVKETLKISEEKPQKAA